RGVTIFSPAVDGSRVFFGETDISDARLDLYTSATQTFVFHNNYQDNVSGFNGGTQAYSAEAGLAIQGLGSTINVYDNSLHLLQSLQPLGANASFAAAAFDATGAHV